ncbi:hypothetical protein ACVWXO_007973 [Bradyrhizobium sp. LM2.7]
MHRQAAIAIVFFPIFVPNVAAAAEWVFAPRDQSALRQLDNDGLLARINNVTASCDYEIKQPIVMHRLDRSDGFELFVSCVRAKGVEVLTPPQFRAVADEWNSKHPEQKARGVLLNLAD